MLVLSRKEHERLYIGSDITVTVRRIAGSRVTLGIDAPRKVNIRRGEVAPIDNDLFAGHPHGVGSEVQP